MKLFQVSLVLGLSLPFGLFSCTGNGANVDEKKEDSTFVLQDITRAAYQKADSLLVTMTLEERVGQCLMPSLFSSDEKENVSLLKEYIEDYHIGGVVLLKGDRKSVRLLSDLSSESRIPLFFAIDAEWGLGMRLTDASVFPLNGNFPEATTEIDMYDYGREIAVDSREIGINMVLGPVVDVASGLSGIIGKRSFGSDPVRVSDFGVSYAKGLESGGVISVAKHFPGHGSTYNDSHKGVAILNRTINTLDSLDLKPFRDYINSGLSGIMAGHISSRALDPQGLPASVSWDILSSLLREELGFNGLILTDAFNMGGANGFSAAAAIKAGADIVLSPSDIREAYRNLLENVENGFLDVRTLDDRCLRILFYKIIFHLKPC